MWDFKEGHCVSIRGRHLRVILRVRMKSRCSRRQLCGGSLSGMVPRADTAKRTMGSVYVSKCLISKHGPNGFAPRVRRNKTLFLEFFLSPSKDALCCDAEASIVGNVNLRTRPGDYSMHTACLGHWPKGCSTSCCY